MDLKYIPLRVNRDFGEIISTYFDFFKLVIKPFTNLFIRYNGIFIIGLLLVSYLLTTGFMGMITESKAASQSGSVSNNIFADNLWTIGIGYLLYLIIMIIVGTLNYSLSSAFMIKIQEKETLEIEGREIMVFIKERIGKITLFVLLFIPIYIAFSIVSFIALIIPFLGFFIYIIFYLFLLVWLGVSFMELLQNDREVIDAYKEGWSLIIGDFWKSIGVFFIITLLIWILLMLVLTAPSILIGVYIYHSVDIDSLADESILTTVLITISFCILLIVGVYSQCLSQFANGLLYYSLHEKTYNLHARKRIDEIGSGS